MVTGVFTGAVTEGDLGDVVTAAGTIAISDVDGDDSPTFADTTVAGSFGSLTLVGGAWTYTLDQSSVQDLDAGDVVNDTVTLTATDGTTQNITITITGTDDAPVVTGVFTGAVTEGDVGDVVTATGTIAINDVDGDDSPVFADTTMAGSFGSLTLVGGAWTYTLDQSSVQNLDAGDVVNDTVTLTATDGTTQNITITITGTDDAPVVTGVFTGAVTEGDVGDVVTASGTIAISDVDGDDSPVFADTTVAGSFGSLVLVGGAWTYTLDQSTVQDLDAGDVVTDTVTLTATDGTTQNITITITGTDDAPVVTGVFTGAVTEGDLGDVVTATGTIAISDVDGDDSPVFADTTVAGSFGSLTLVGGAWTYTLDQSSVQDLDAGDVVNDTLTLTASDGTTQNITITITGTDDAPVVTGVFTGAVTEGDLGDVTTASGTIAISDVDGDDSPVFADTTVAGSFGSLVLVGGAWTYTLDQSTVQDLDAGDVVNDTLTLTASDGTTQNITITITGTDDAPVVTGVFTGAVTEGDLGDVTTASGTIAISDVDGDDSPTFADTTVAGSFGALTLVGGAWTYTLDQSTVQDLDAGDIVNDTLTLTASDGTTQDITIAITGTDDAPVVTGVFTGAVTEGDLGDVVIATGTIAISDVDGDDSPVFADTTMAGSFGSLVLVGGAWTYTLDQSSVQTLDVGDIVTDTVTLTATDGTTQNITITITGTNDAPVASASAVSTTEDTPLTFSASDFGFVDVEGHAMASITIQTLESVGSLQLSGVNVVEGQTISLSDLTSGLLTYTPLPNTSGAAYDNFTFTVNDADAGTSSATMVVNVTPVNDGPLGPVADVDATKNRISVTAGVDTPVGITALATDPDPEDTVTYSLIDDAGGLFKIDPVTGVVTVDAAIGAVGPYDITVQATSSDGSPAQTAVMRIHVVGAADDFAVVHESGLIGGSGRAETTFDSNDEVGQNVAAGEATRIATGNLLANDGTATSITSINGTAPVSGTITVTTTNGVLVVDAASGNYTYTLTSAADNSGAGNDLSIDETFSYTTNVGTNANFNVTIIDDTPQTADFVQDVPEGQMQDYHLVLTLDVSGSMTEAQFDGVIYLPDGSTTTRLEMARDALKTLVEEYHSQSDNVSVHLVTFSTNAQVLNGGAAYTDLAATLAAIDTMVGPGGTNYEDGLVKTIDALDADGDGSLDLTGSNLETITYFISDGVPTSGNTTDPVGASGWDTFTANNGVSSFAVGIGSGITDFSSLNAIHNVDSDGSGTVDEAIYVPNLNTLEEALLSTVPSSFGGSIVVSGAVQTVLFGADGGHVESIAINLDTDADGTPDTLVTFSYDAVADEISNDGGFATITGSILSLHATGYGFVEGSLIIDFDSGDYNYYQSAAVAEGDSFDITFIASDGDGDSTPATTITLSIIDGQPVANDDTDTLFAFETELEGNVLTGQGTDSGVSNSSSFTTFSQQGEGVDNTVDNATVTSIEYRGDTIDLTTSTGGTINATASDDGSSYSYSVDSSGVLTLTNTTDGSALTFNTTGYYHYTPATVATSPTGPQVVETFTDGNAAQGVSLSSPDGNIVYDTAGSWQGIGVDNNEFWRLDDGDRVIIDFDTTTYQYGVSGVGIETEINHVDFYEVYNLVAYHVDGHVLGTESVKGSGWHNVFSEFSNIGRIELQAGSATSSNLRGVRFAPVLLDTAASAITPEVIEYTITDDDGDSDSATLTLKGITNSIVDTAGTNVVTGTDANDFISGLDGDDTLSGGLGYDILEGGAGADILSGGADGDVLTGGDGADNLSGDAGDDVLSGNAGDDVLTGGSGADKLSGGDDDDLLVGNSGADVLHGDAGFDVLQGGDGQDSLYGGTGDDILSGGDGIDFLSGGQGNDTLTGGTQSDTFHWGANDRGSSITPDADVITDFTVGIGGDLLDLSELLQGEESNPLTDYLTIDYGDFDGDLDNETRISVDHDGGIFFQASQTITLDNVDLTAGGSLTDQEIINNLISDGNLNVDS